MATLENNYQILKYTAIAGQKDFTITWKADNTSDIYFRINNDLTVCLQNEYSFTNNNSILSLDVGLNAGDKIVIYRQKEAEQAFEFITGGALTMKMLQENNNDIFYILQDILENYLNITDLDQIVDFLNNIPDASETVRGLIKLSTEEEAIDLTDKTKAITPFTLGKVIEGLEIGGGTDTSDNSFYDSKRKSIMVYSGGNITRDGDNLKISPLKGVYIDVNESFGEPVEGNEYLTDDIKHNAIKFESPEIIKPIQHFNKYVNLYLSVSYDRETKEFSYAFVEIPSGFSIEEIQTFNFLYLGYGFNGMEGQANMFKYFDRKDYFFDLDKRTVRSFDYARKVKDLSLSLSFNNGFLRINIDKDFSIFAKNANAIVINNDGTTSYQTQPNNDFKIYNKQLRIPFYFATNNNGFSVFPFRSISLTNTRFGFIDKPLLNSIEIYNQQQKYTNLRIFINSFGEFMVQRGQFVYDTFASAINNIDKEDYLYNLGTREWEWVYSLTVQTNLQDDADFILDGNVGLTRIIDGFAVGKPAGGSSSLEEMPVGVIIPFNASLKTDKWLDCDGLAFNANEYPLLAALDGYNSMNAVGDIDFTFPRTMQIHSSAELIRKDYNNSAFKNRSTGFQTRLSVNEGLNINYTGSSLYNILDTIGDSLICYPMVYPDAADYAETLTILGKNYFNENYKKENFCFACDTTFKPQIMAIIGSVVYDFFSLTSKTIEGIPDGYVITEKHWDPVRSRFVITATGGSGSLHYLKMFLVNPYIEQPFANEVFSMQATLSGMLVPFCGNKTPRGGSGAISSRYTLNSRISYVNGGNNFVDDFYYFFDLYNKTIFKVSAVNFTSSVVYTSNGVFKWLDTNEGAVGENGKMNNGIYYSSTIGSTFSINMGRGQGFINADKEFMFIDAQNRQAREIVIKKTKDFITFETILLNSTNLTFFEDGRYRDFMLSSHIDQTNGFTLIQFLYSKGLNDGYFDYFTVYNNFNDLTDKYADIQVSNVLNWECVLIGDHLVNSGYSYAGQSGDWQGAFFNTIIAQANNFTPLITSAEEAKYKYYLKGK
jgi:hypothetical protein